MMLFDRRLPEYAAQFDDHQLDSDVTNHVFDAEKTRLRGHIHHLNYKQTQQTVPNAAESKK
ncbi:hypothetical protein D3C84_1212960 [compost metagenome]